MEKLEQALRELAEVQTTLITKIDALLETHQELLNKVGGQIKELTEEAYRKASGN